MSTPITRLRHRFLNLVFRLATTLRQKWLVSLMSRFIPLITVGKTGDYRTIKDALDATTAWRTLICVEPGQYREHVEARR